jgi:hypothetical protein
MKSRFSFLYRLLPAALMLFGFALKAGSNTSTDVMMVWPSNYQIPAGTLLHIKLDMDTRSAACTQLLSGNVHFSPIVETVRTQSVREGRVDVDIIIRGDYLMEGLMADPMGSQNGSVKFSLFDFEHDVITVDNISGVMQSSGNNTHINARITEILIEQPGDAPHPMEVSGKNREQVISSVQIQSSLPEAARAVQTETTLYPNPVSSGMLHLAVAGSFTASRVEVVNALGAVLYTVSANATSNRIDIPTESLSKGIYFLRYQMDGKDQVKRFMVTR